jgi:hypothetical protein
MRVKIMSVSKKIFLLPIVCLSLLSFFTSCSSTKYLKENQYLLKDNKIIPDSNIVDRSEIKAYANQKPNRRILGWPFYISLYNMVDPAKEADRDIKRQKKLTEKISKENKRVES